MQISAYLKRFLAFGMMIFLDCSASARAEQVFCPEASPYQTFRLGRVNWTHEYSTLLLRRIQIGPGNVLSTRIYCEKLYGIVSAEVEGECRFLPGAGQVQTEAELGIKTCLMPPHENRRTNIEDCKIICEAPSASDPMRP